MRCGEVAAMPRAFGWMGGWRSRREMEEDEENDWSCAANRHYYNLPAAAAVHHFKLPRHSSFKKHHIKIII